MNRVRARFALRLFAFSIVLIILSVGLSSILVYRQSKQDLAHALGDELLAVVNSTAPLLDGDIHQLIFQAPDGTLDITEEFELIRSQLVKVRESNRLPPSHGSPLYTMRKAADFDQTGQLEFVVMTDPDQTGSFFTGNRYAAEPHNVEALAGHPAVTGIYRDSEGIWISANAPIRDSAHHIVGVLQADRPVAFFYDEARKRAFAILLSAVVGMLIAAVLAVIFARTLVRPINMLVQATGIIRRGDLSHRVAIRRSDEIGELADAFNQMTAQLDQAHTELIEWNKTLEQRVAERTRQLEDAQRRLVQSEKLAALGHLAAGVAHEINNPLTAILGNGQLALRLMPPTGTLEEDARKQFVELLQVLIEEARRSKAIVSGMLNFAHAATPTKGPLQIVQILDESVTHIEHQLGLTDITVERFYPDAVPAILGDRNELVQLFMNLMLNGIQSMSPGGRLALRVGVEGQWVAVSVTDTGCGIPAEHLSKIFDPFFTTKEPGKGTGLGLSLAHGMVKRHEGTIDVQSVVGQGTTVTVKLPVAAGRV